MISKTIVTATSEVVYCNRRGEGPNQSRVPGGVRRASTWAAPVLDEKTRKGEPGRHTLPNRCRSCSGGGNRGACTLPPALLQRTGVMSP